MTKNPLLKHTAILVLAALAYTLLLNFSLSKQTFFATSAPIVHQTILLIATLLFSILCFRQARRLLFSWRNIFIFLSLSAFLKAIFHLFLILYLIQPGTLRFSNKIIYQFLGVLAYFLELAAWLSLARYLLLRSKTKWRKWAPFLPALFTLLLTIILLLVFHKHHIFFSTFNDWLAFSISTDIFVFIAIIFCFPMLKNVYLILLAEGFILIIIAELFKLNLQSTQHLLYLNSYINFFTVLGYLILIYAAYQFYQEQQHKEQQWLYAINSTRAQILYWGMSISSLLFFLICLHAAVFSKNPGFINNLFNINIRILIPFISLFFSLSLLFTRLFVNDFNTIKILSRRHVTEAKPGKKNRVIHFYELRKFSSFLQQKIKVTLQKTKTRKNLFIKSGQAAHDLRTPLTILTMMSTKASTLLSETQWERYNQSIASIRKTIIELLELQDLASEQSSTTLLKQTHYKYISLFVLDFIELHAAKHPQVKLLLSAKQNNAWFCLSTIDSQIFLNLLNQVTGALIAAKNKGNDIHIQLNTKPQCNSTSCQLIINTALLQTFDQDALLIQIKEDLLRCKANVNIVKNNTNNTTILLNIPQMAQAPTWWINSITLPKFGNIIIFDDDPLCHQQWDHALEHFLSQHPDTKVKHCFNESEFLSELKTDKAKYFLMDYDIHAADKTGLEYIDEHHLQHCATLTTNHYYHPEIQAQCEEKLVALLPKPLISHVHCK